MAYTLEDCITYRGYLREVHIACQALDSLLEHACLCLRLEEQGRIDLTQEQRDALFLEYTTRKQAVIDAFSQLP